MKGFGIGRLKGNSIRVRLFIASLASIALALVIAGFGLIKLFEHHVERRFTAELTNHMRQLAGNLTFGTDGAVTMPVQLSDPRFNQPLSGLYWQVSEEGKKVSLRSRSLWDTTLATPSDTLTPGEIHNHILQGPLKAELLTQEELIIYDTSSGKRPVRITVAIDRNELLTARHEFAEALMFSLGLLAVVLLGASWLQIVVGLRPLEAVRQGVNAVRARQKQRLEDGYPDEVMPLVAEVNTLLDAQDQTIERARTRAGDLAHGLKTPLTVLVANARKLKEKGEVEFGQEIDEMVKLMQRHIERELTRTRVAAEARQHMDAGADAVRVVRGVVEALRKTPRGSTLDWRMALPERLDTPVQSDDRNRRWPWCAGKHDRGARSTRRAAR
ncbi:MAG: sensor histidine kinase [Alphaproteobacteria bacterium]